jgi:signal peptidase I
LAFKDRARRFFGIKTHEELNQVKSPKQKTKEFFGSLFFAGIAAFFIITFIIQNTRIPTGSMEETILVGDFVLVNKFVYGSSSPKYIPFTEVEIPFFRLPALKEPKRMDIVVFEYPGERDQLFATPLGINYVKRCIGLPGDTVQIINKVVYVNGEQVWIPPFIKYKYRYSEPEGAVEPAIFPKGMPWNKDNYGPLVIPKEGSTIALNINNYEQWRTIINREHGREVVSVRNNSLMIDGKAVDNYTFKKNYYFMMGDNRDDSADSRYWGLVPRDLVIGEAFITLFSWNREIPFSDLFRLLGSIRLDRVLKLIN